MFTPAIEVEILKSSAVICRAQPPFWIASVKVERRPILRHAVDVGCRRAKERRLLACKVRILRTGIDQRLGVGDVDRALGRRIWVRERGRAAVVAGTAMLVAAVVRMLRLESIALLLLNPFTGLPRAFEVLFCASTVQFLFQIGRSQRAPVNLTSDYVDKISAQSIGTIRMIILLPLTGKRLDARTRPPPIDNGQAILHSGESSEAGGLAPHWNIIDI